MGRLSRLNASRPVVAGGGDGLRMWRVAATVLNKTANDVCSS
jgi:hypothetical protein